MLIKTMEGHHFSLDHFEGPLDFLLYLIQKNEVDIYHISLQQILEQYKNYLSSLPELCMESGAEFIGLTSSLMWLKSKMLLPKQKDDPADENNDAEFAIIHQLIEYCRFKEAAKELSLREEKQSGFFLRGIDPDSPGVKRPFGLEQISLDELSGMFRQLIEKASEKGHVVGEPWSVSDKIHSIRNALQQNDLLEIKDLFSDDISRDEIVVTFLAILELMKLGEIQVMKDTSKDIIIIIPRKNHG